MENKDLIIENALAEIEKKKFAIAEKFKFDANYKFRTNCRFNNENIKTFGIEKLLDVYRIVIGSQISYEYVEKDFPWLKEEKHYLSLYDFNINDWKSDIQQLINKTKYLEKIKELEKGAEALQAYYSKDKQDSIAITNIIQNLLG